MCLSRRLLMIKYVLDYVNCYTGVLSPHLIQDLFWESKWLYCLLAVSFSMLEGFRFVRIAVSFEIVLGDFIFLPKKKYDTKNFLP